MCADDTTMYFIGESVDSVTNMLNNALKELEHWSSKNHLVASLTSLTVVEELNQISSLFLPNVDTKTSKTAKARSKRSDKGPVLKNALLSLLY